MITMHAHLRQTGGHTDRRTSWQQFIAPHEKLQNPGLVAICDISPANTAGLFYNPAARSPHMGYVSCDWLVKCLTILTAD